MAHKVFGNIKGLPPLALRKLNKLFSRSVDSSDLVTRELATELISIATDLNRRVGILVSREGQVEEVMVGTYDLLYLPDLGRYRLGPGRLRRLRLLFTDIGRHTDLPQIPSDIIADLEKLRLDMVVSLRSDDSRLRIPLSYGYLVPPTVEQQIYASRIESVRDLSQISFNFSQYMADLEGELTSYDLRFTRTGRTRAMLVAVGTKSEALMRNSLSELRELADTAGVEVFDEILQRRLPDPKYVLGKGKLEEVILRCLRYSIDILIFDSELRPAQWRSITNATELKVLDRSMVILDIFAQRAKSSEGRLQVELAQLKYNLPRLTERDSGLSRLTGGIGGRGPGETKLEISRRRTRDRITDLERRLKTVQKQRGIRRNRRQEASVPLVAIVGYTNAGKSTLFNLLTNAGVLAEDRLFATLDPFQRRTSIEDETGTRISIVLSDTVGFIRDLPKELLSAFRATLEELYEATLLLHVVDISDPLHDSKRQSVEKILTNMELNNIPTILVGNKIDLLKEVSESHDIIDDTYDVVVSAVTSAGICKMRKIIAKALTTSQLSACL